MVEYDKQRKVDFVSGLTGSSVSDVNKVSLALPVRFTKHEQPIKLTFLL